MAGAAADGAGGPSENINQEQVSIVSMVVHYNADHLCEETSV
jgi:hypothetical protein